MPLKSIIFLLSTFLLLSCRAVNVYDYVHEPTHNLRNYLIHKNGDINISRHTKESILFIPNLRTFTSSFSSPKYVDVYACSMKKGKVFLAKVTLINNDTNHEVGKELNKIVLIEKKISGRYVEYKQFCKSISLFDDKDINYKDNFMNAKSLTLKVYYRYPGSSLEKEQIFKINLKKDKQIAWPT
tara:strand:+ start:106 stop:657 length:552 start_codon:yes stop_codon:yes gene_type:complete